MTAAQNKTKPPKGFGLRKAAQELDLREWQFKAAVEKGLIERPDRGKQWSPELIEAVKPRVQEIIEAVAEPETRGPRKCAEIISEALEIEADWPDIKELTQQGLLVPAKHLDDVPLYDVQHVEELTKTHAGVIEQIVSERLGWMAESLHPSDARRRLGLGKTEFDKVVAERGVTAGRFGRYSTLDIEALADDEELLDDVLDQRTMTARQAAELLEIRVTDFQLCRAAGWIEPADYKDVKVSGRSSRRKRWISYPVFRRGDVRALLDIDDVDWEAVRSVKPGEPSPLREFAKQPIARGVLVRGFAADLGEHHKIEVTATYDDDNEMWTLSWPLNQAGQPTRDQVRKQLREDRDLKPHASAILLRTEEP